MFGCIIKNSSDILISRLVMISLLHTQIQELEGDKRDLERQVNELKAKCDAIEKREAERRAIEEKKHAEEIQFLKRTNQQLKVCSYML